MVTSKNTKATAGNKRTPLQAAVQAFQDVVGDPTLIQNGQFIWSSRYRDELLTLVDQLVATNPALNAFWRTPNAVSGTSLRADFVRLTTAPIDNAKTKDFNDLVKQTLSDPAMQDGSAQAAQLRALLTDAGNGGPAAYTAATGLLNSGTRVLPGTPEFLQAFPQRALSFRGALRISESAQSKCFVMTNAVCRFVAHRGGLGTVVPKTNPNPLGQIFLQEPSLRSPQGLSSGIRRFQAPLRDLLAFSPELSKMIRLCKATLDQGYLVNAGVVSGAEADKPTFDPDHFVPIIAWEQRNAPFPHTVFAFWDPDASVTNDLAAHFGRLFFLDGASAQQAADSSPNPNLGIQSAPPDPRVRPYSNTFYARSGRLTTALFDSELRVDGSGDFTAVVSATDQGRTPRSLRGKNHRYQVTTVSPQPGSPVKVKR